MSKVIAQRDELRQIVCDVLELEPSELDDTADFVEVYEADSLAAIEVLARIEKSFDIEIPQDELAQMKNLEATSDIVDRYVRGG